MNRESLPGKVSTVNYHLWQPCNMRCGFCFATFLDTPFPQPANFLPQADAVRLVNLLSEAGFRKINFAGGEPTLCPWLLNLIRQAKSHGLTTSIVTNGSRIKADWLDSLDGCLDIITLSIDSVDAITLTEIGRTVAGKPMSAADYRGIAGMIKERGIRLKINTVVNRANHAEDFRPFIQSILPERWKIFQALPVGKQNDARIGELAVTNAEFNQYVQRNRPVEREGIVVVPEDNRLMTGSYVMVDPLGRLFDNTKGEHTYSRPVLEAGLTAAWQEITVSAERFAERGGDYA